MQAALEFAPLVAFIVAYRLAGLYVATGVLMGSMAVVVLLDLVRGRRIPPMHALSAVLVFVFGTATLALHDQRFLFWKPTVFFWLASGALLASFWVGERPLVQRLLSAAIGGEDARIPPVVWRRLNFLWVVFYALLGVVNLLVAFNASERVWVNFKVFGLTIATFLFVSAQVMWLTRRMGPAASASSAQV